MGAIEQRAGVIFSLITSLLFCGAAFGVAQTQIKHNREAIKTYEEDHDRLIAIENNIKWIRSTLEKMERNQ
tara:strand:- start:707 stop:919 length:213 start_codon:yes stop_codon:yes gene_type:complete